MRPIFSIPHKNIKKALVFWCFMLFSGGRGDVEKDTTPKMTFSIKDFFSKYDQIHRFLRIWSHLLKKSLMENSFFCAVRGRWTWNELRIEALVCATMEILSRSWFKINESWHIALFVVSRSMKKLSSIDYVNIYFFSTFFFNRYRDSLTFPTKQYYSAVFRGVFRTQSNIHDRSFLRKQFAKKLHRRCLTGISLICCWCLGKCFLTCE